jgi:hypothetical protein
VNGRSSGVAVVGDTEMAGDGGPVLPTGGVRTLLIHCVFS